MISKNHNEFFDITQNEFRDITNSILWFLKSIFDTISQNWFCDIKWFCDITKYLWFRYIKKSILWYLKIIFIFQFFRKMIAPAKFKAHAHFKWTQIMTTSNRQVQRMTRRSFFMGIIISSVENTSYFVISQNLFFDILIFWYHKILFVISQNPICDIKNQGYFVISKNLFCDIKKSNLWYHKIDFFWYKN